MNFTPATPEELVVIQRLQRWHNDNIVDGRPCGDWHVESMPDAALMVLRNYVRTVTTVRSPTLREVLGARVRRIWIYWAEKQPNPKPSWLVPWSELPEPDREVDRLIGEELFMLGRRSITEFVQSQEP